jgi:hypothetical protein
MLIPYEDAFLGIIDRDKHTGKRKKPMQVSTRFNLIANQPISSIDAAYISFV